jgi:hypothetical protein
MNLNLKRVFCLILVILLIPCGSVFGQTFTDSGAFEDAVESIVKIDFEGIATEGGQAGAVDLVGDEFLGITLSAGTGADGLYVGIPDSSIPGGNNVNFFAADFFPTSGIAVFSPDLIGAPVGELIVDFDTPTAGVGVYFLDVEGAVSSIEAFDGPGGSGVSLGEVTLQNQGDNSQAFAGIVADDIKSAVIIMGGGGDGVGLDDLWFGGPVGVALDIKPGSCPNPVNVKSKGVLPVALLGTSDFDVSQIDIATVKLEGIDPIRSSYEDVATPVEPFSGKEDCYEDCEEVYPDGYTDLTLKFDTQEVVDALGDVYDGDCLVLKLTADLMDGTPIEGEDVVLILDKPNPQAEKESKGKK